MLEKCGRWGFYLCLLFPVVFVMNYYIAEWSVLPPVWVMLVFAVISIVLGGIGFQNKHWLTILRGLFTIFFSFVLTAVLMFILLMPEANELLETTESPDGAHKVNVYLKNGGATTSYFIIGKRAGPLWLSKTIYSKEGTDEANVSWKNEDTLLINGTRIQIDAG